jgi:hypothetical protein
MVKEKHVYRSDALHYRPLRGKVTSEVYTRSMGDFGRAYVGLDVAGEYTVVKNVIAK